MVYVALSVIAAWFVFLLAVLFINDKFWKGMPSEPRQGKGGDQ